MSSTRMQRRPSTSPMMFMTSETPARSRRLSMIARSASSRRAIVRARTTPPTSGETMTRSRRGVMVEDVLHQHRRGDRDCRSGCRRSPGSAPAWRSSVSTRSAPAAVIMLATSLAEIGVREPGFAVLPGIAVIGDDRRHPPRRGALQRVERDQQLHQMVVGRIRGRLDHEDVLAAHVFVDLDKHLHVRKAAHARIGQRQVEIGRNRLGERPIAVAGEDFHQAAASTDAGGPSPAASRSGNVTIRDRSGNRAAEQGRAIGRAASGFRSCRPIAARRGR